MSSQRCMVHNVCYSLSSYRSSLVASFWCRRTALVPSPTNLLIPPAAHISPLISSSTPGVFYTYFYSHAHRLRLEKLLYLELSRSPKGFLKYFWIQVAVSEVKRPLRNRFGSETVTNL
jgi:hypothetical protein